MKKITLLIPLILLGLSSFAQVNDGLIALGKYYRQFMSVNAPPESVLDGFKQYENTELAFTAAFIKEILTTNNNILSDKFLTRPDDKDLKYIYIVRHVNYNIRKAEPEDNNEFVTKLLAKDITTEDMLDTYYSIVFNGYGNKDKPFDLSKVNFEPDKYHFRNDTEKGIFFLESMDLNGTEIWGYINIVKPPRYEEALKYINNYPKYNGSPYYQYLDLGFPDFKISMEVDKKPQSYKEYYINKYYDTLLSHLACLQNSGKSKEEIEDLVLGSILKESNYYKYSKHQSDIKNLLVVYKK